MFLVHSNHETLDIDDVVNDIISRPYWKNKKFHLRRFIDKKINNQDLIQHLKPNGKLVLELRTGGNFFMGRRIELPYNENAFTKYINDFRVSDFLETMGENFITSPWIIKESDNEFKRRQNQSQRTFWYSQFARNLDYHFLRIFHTVDNFSDYMKRNYWPSRNLCHYKNSDDFLSEIIRFILKVANVLHKDSGLESHDEIFKTAVGFLLTKILKSLISSKIVRISSNR